MYETKRIVCWFSCGVTSTVATKLVLDKYKNSNIPIVIAYCDTGSEHPDNKRFLKDCEQWFDYPITILKNPKYSNIYDVFAETKFMANRFGAKCSLELKKRVRQHFENLNEDLQIFGYDKNEISRVKIFSTNNPEVTTNFPLVDANLSKADCIRLLCKAGIEIPTMYTLGYKNNNCIGCVKGRMGYWNKIRKDFPDIFEKTCRLSREYGARLVIYKEKHLFLDQIEPTWGNYKSELPIECGLFCGQNP